MKYVDKLSINNELEIISKYHSLKTFSAKVVKNQVELDNSLKMNADFLELLNLPDLAPIIHKCRRLNHQWHHSASIFICKTRNSEMIGKLYQSGQTCVLGSCGPTHQSLYLLDPTTDKWSLLLLNTNSVSFLMGNMGQVNDLYPPRSSGI